MVIKNGRLFYKLGIKSGTTKANKIVVKNGFIFHKLGNAAAGYGQKVLSIRRMGGPVTPGFGNHVVDL